MWSIGTPFFHIRYIQGLELGFVTKGDKGVEVQRVDSRLQL